MIIKMEIGLLSDFLLSILVGIASFHNPGMAHTVYYTEKMYFPDDGQIQVQRNLSN